MRYLVTGGAGFIGSHIVRRLLLNGCEVRILDNFSTGKDENLKEVIANVELIRGDIRDNDVVARAVRGVDFVLHQAALRSVPKSMTAPEEYNDVNVNGTLNLLIASRDTKVRRFVFASSSSVYGEVKKLPQTETDALMPISPYATTKLIGERYCQLFASAYGVQTVSLRYFNVFGPRQNLDSEYAVVIPKFITCMLKGERPPIYGDGTQTRDFTYVENIVSANLAACEAETQMNGDVFNAAGGDARSVLDLVRELNSILGTSIEPDLMAPRKGDVMHTLASPLLIEARLGWELKVDFNEGLRQTVDWFKKRGGQ